MRRVLIILSSLLSINCSCFSQDFQLTDTAFVSGQTMNTYCISFDFAGAKLRLESNVFLDSLVIFLQNNEALVLEIRNHSDERGSDHYSTCLTCKRAESIMTYLVSKGISRENLVAKGYGESLPKIPNAVTEEEHRVNRRTDFQILRTDFKP